MIVLSRVVHRGRSAQVYLSLVRERDEFDSYRLTSLHRLSIRGPELPFELFLKL